MWGSSMGMMWGSSIGILWGSNMGMESASVMDVIPNITIQAEIANSAAKPIKTLLLSII